MNDKNMWLSLNLLQKFRMSLKYHKTSDKDINKIILDYQDCFFFFFNEIKNPIKYISDAFSSNIAIVD